MDEMSGIGNSRLKGLRDKSPAQRLANLGECSSLSDEDLSNLAGESSLPVEVADGMIENVIGKFELPMGVATNFVVNGRDYLIPMAVEEPSVVAAASYMARLARENGGFSATSTDPIMRAQVQIVGIPDLDKANNQIMAEKAAIIEAANARDTVLVGLGGGCKDIEIHTFPETEAGPMLVMHLLVDVRDAMGANTVNTMAEIIAPMVESLSGGEVRLRILSNLADLRVTKAKVTLTPELLTTKDYAGERVIKGILEAYAFAAVDPYRAATHNKGIMNGIDPVVVATGNDWRAIEAGAHAFAARNGRYTSLSKWQKGERGELIGTLELPMALGLVGGATKTHPAAQAALKLMNVHSANELSQIVTSVGLAQNLAALRALATEGIQRGHMALHARNIAISAGASGKTIDQIVAMMIETGDVSTDKARSLLDTN